MIRSDITTDATEGPYTVRQVGERWLVVRQVPGTETLAVVADCRTESAARYVADDLNVAAGVHHD